MLSDVLPTHAPCEDKRRNGRSAHEIEHMINALAVSLQDAGQVRWRDHLLKACGSKLDDFIGVHTWSVFGDCDTQALAEVCLGEGEKSSAAEVETENENGHGDRDLSVRHQILNSDERLRRRRQ